MITKKTEVLEIERKYHIYFTGRWWLKVVINTAAMLVDYQTLNTHGFNG